MKNYPVLALCLAGICAGTVNGLFGGAGGMVLVPILSRWSNLKEEEIFPASLSVIFPICVVSLCFQGYQQGLPAAEALPYLAGGSVGGLLAGLYGNRIPVKWLHRGLGILIVWGGIRYLC